MTEHDVTTKDHIQKGLESLSKKSGSLETLEQIGVTLAAILKMQSILLIEIREEMGKGRLQRHEDAINLRGLLREIDTKRDIRGK